MKSLIAKCTRCRDTFWVCETHDDRPWDGEHACGCGRMQFLIHPHMLRHGCGYALANAGHDTRALQAWLGHKNIQHTVRYTELAPDRFKNFWRD